jgi:CubicO group peptidase (beta-lactamase class C family)
LRYKSKAIVALLIFYIASAAWSQSSPGPAPLRVLDPIIEEAINAGQAPGAVVIVGHNGQVIYRKAFGSRAIEPRREAMSVDTIFDIASLTKVVATTIAVMQLVDQGKVRINDPVIRYLPEFAQNGKEDVTVRELLTHFSGLPEDLDRAQPWKGGDAAIKRAMAESLVSPAGARFRYSDVNFITLGALVEQVSGMSLDEYCQKYIFARLGMTATRFLPPESWRSRIAPSEYDENRNMLRGVVHDPTARRMGGVAGHAGVFATADDLAKLAQALLTGTPILSPLAIEKMTTPQQPPNAEQLRGLGWDIDSPFSSNRGEFLPVGSQRKGQRNCVAVEDCDCRCGCSISYRG